MPASFQTRPALRTVIEGESSPGFILRFTLAFHPMVARIGATVDLARLSARDDGGLKTAVALGRDCSVLSDGEAIGEPHVSRKALVISQRQHNSNIALSSFSLVAPAQSTTRLGIGNASELLVDGAELQRGMLVRLGHGVVGVLRLVGPTTLVQSDEHENAQPSLSNEMSELIGCSYEWQQLCEQIALVSKTDLPVLILGESGVGKELIARAIHTASLRANHRLVAVNAAAIPEALAASELFGAEKGAFTGATARQGYFQQAAGSSLFLDEIADLPQSAQAQLLRALESGEVQRVGGTIEKLDVRLIAATDGQLDDTKVMSAALFNRLRGFVINVPPLRQRPEDIAAQLVHMLGDALAFPTRATQQSEASDQAIAHWASVFFDCLANPWHGNSRELQFFAQRAALGDSRAVPMQSRRVRLNAQAQPVEQVDPGELKCDDDTLYNVHRNNDFEVRATAAALGWSRGTTYRRIQAHPQLRLAADISGEEIRDALARAGDVKQAAQQLGVSVSALRPRLRALVTG